MGSAFKKAFEDFEIDPNIDLWEDISKRNIELGNTKTHTNLYRIVASVAVFAIVSIAAYMIYSSESKNEQNKIAEEITPSEMPVVDNNIVPIEVKNETNVIIESKSSNKKEQIQNPSKHSIDINQEEDNNDIIIVKSVTKKENAIVELENKEFKTLKDTIYIVDKLDNEVVIANSDNKIRNTNTELLPKEEISEIEPFKVNFGDDKIVCFGEDATLEVEEGYRYNWSNGLMSSKIKVSPTENSIYSVTVTNQKGQTQMHDYAVNIDRGCSALFIPSAFTPNFDGQNDVFKAEGNGILKMKMFVFDKFGTKVFEANSVDDEWDGSYRGAILEEGVFFYKAEYTDGHGYAHVKNGQITLIK